MGSKNNKAGESKADKANKQVQKQQEAIQATEAKEVRSTPYGRSLGRDLADTSKYGGKLKGAIERANFRNSVLGRNPALNQLADPLGRSGLTTDRFGRVRNTGEYNVTPGGMQDTVRGTLGSRDISQLGRMIDSGNFANLNEQAAANRMFGFNPTKGMGILDSLRYGATNPEAKRGYQRLSNLAKGIATLSPVQNVFRGMLGIDPVKMTEISPYNIGPGFSEFPNRFDMFSNPELEGMTENAVYSRLFNDVAPVQTGMFNPPAAQIVGQQQFAPRYDDGINNSNVQADMERYGTDFTGGTISLDPAFTSPLQNTASDILGGQNVANIGANSLAEQMGMQTTMDFDGDGQITADDQAIGAQNFVQGALPGSANILAGGLDALTAANQNFQNQQQALTDPFATAYTGNLFNQ